MTIRIFASRRRFLQFSLKTLLLLMLVAGAACGWFKWKLDRKEKERAAVLEIKKIGGRVAYDWEVLPIRNPSIKTSRPPGPSWLRRRLGEDFFSRPVELALSHAQVTAKCLVHLEPLTELTVVSFIATKITDDGIRYLTRFKKMEELSLMDNTVTAAGFAHLQELPALRRLYLYDCARVDDAALAHIGKLKGLEELTLYDISATDSGIVHLQGLTRLRKMCLYHTDVTDAGLTYLSGLANLTELGLQKTAVTDAGLVHLRSLSKLKVLKLYGTAVTRPGIMALQEALPACDISGV